MDVLWLVGAYVLGLAASQVGLPPLVGYLGAGLALSTMGVTGAGALAEIGHFGVLFLLFTVGLHLRFRNLLSGEVLGAGGVHLLLTAAVFAVAGIGLGLEARPAIVLGLALAFSSTVLAAKALEDRRALGAYPGRVAIGILVLQDVTAVAVVAVAGGEAVGPLAPLVLLLPLARPLLLRLLAASGREELQLLYGLLLALGGAALFAAVGLGDELGALAAGVLVAGEPRSDELAERLWGLKEAFLVGFFLVVGLTGFPDAAGWLLVGGLLALLPLKSGLFFALLLLFRLRARSAYLTSLSLTSYSEFALIVGAVAVGQGLLGEAVLVVLALAAAGSFALNALLNRWANPLYERWESRLVAWERAGPHPDDQPRSLGSAGILIVGMGRVGTAAYDAVTERGMRPLGLDIDPARIQRHLESGRRVIYGDATDPELWSALHLGRLEAVIMTLADPEAEASAAEMLRARGFRGAIHALATRREEEERLRGAGVNTICHPLVQAGIQLAENSVGDRAA